MEIEKVKEIFQVKTSVGESCPYCRKGDPFSGFSARVNHYLDHGFVLLHVGQETTRDDEGKPWHDTVAVLGSNKPPKRMPPPRIVIKTSARK